MHSTPLLYSVVIASAIPLVFLFIVKWLNFFDTHRPRLIVVALVWGAISMGLSYAVDHPLVPIFGRPMVTVRIGPFVEEIWKSLILLYLVTRADYTYFVDGAIYGFAVGIGFAVAENMLYLSRVDVNTGLIVAITRAFSSSVMHGSSTALVGIAVGGFPMARAVHPLVALVIGLAVAIAYHMTYNHIALLALGQEGLLIICGLAFAGLALVAAAILWGLQRERRRLRKSLGMKARVSKGESRLVQRIDDLDDLLAPVEERFGEDKRDEVANVLVLGAQLAMKQDQIRRTRDSELRAELAAQITDAKRELKRRRHDVGIYVMSYVRSIVPKTTWSLWARVEQALSALQPPVTNLWELAAARVAGGAPSAQGMHAHVWEALRERAYGQDDAGNRQ